MMKIDLLAFKHERVYEASNWQFKRAITHSEMLIVASCYEKNSHNDFLIFLVPKHYKLRKRYYVSWYLRLRVTELC